MNCKNCGEEFIELVMVDLGYGQKLARNECPNHCEEIQWLENQGKLLK